MVAHNVRFGNLVASRRRELRISQNDLGAHMGVTQSAVSRWETGEIDAMAPGDVTRLAARLEVPPTVIANALGYPTDGCLDRSAQDSAWLSQMPRDLDDDTWALVLEYAVFQAARTKRKGK